MQAPPSGGWGGVHFAPNPTLPATEQWVGELLHDEAALDTLKPCVPRIWSVLTARLVLVDAPPPCTGGTTKAITAEDTVECIPRDPRRGSAKLPQLNTPRD